MEARRWHGQLSGHKRQGKQGLEDFLPRGSPQSGCEVKEGKERQNSQQTTSNPLPPSSPYNDNITQLAMASINQIRNRLKTQFDFEYIFSNSHLKGERKATHFELAKRCLIRKVELHLHRDGASRESWKSRW